VKLTVTIDCDAAGPAEASALLRALDPATLAVSMLSGNPLPLFVNDRNGLRQVGELRFTADCPTETATATN